MHGKCDKCDRACCCRATWLTTLTVNQAVLAADAWAMQLSTLAVAFDFPAVDLALPSVEYDARLGSVAAMPLAQVGGGWWQLVAVGGGWWRLVVPCQPGA